MNPAVAFALGCAAGILAASAAWAWSRRRAPRPGPTDEGVETRAELLSKISHELKNPIMAVKGLAATGTRLYGSMDDDERKEFFQLIDAEAERLRQIAEATSTALKIDAGTIRYDLRPEDLGKLVEEVAWRAQVGQHAMVVGAEEGLVADVDRDRFSEVLGQLIDNAAKYSPPDAPIEVRAHRASDGAVLVDVVDRGPGIPAEQRGAVFERYSAWRPAGYEETPGAGLGLFICRQHLKAHGGRIDIEDMEERGSMLRITLPTGA